jgi:hypothetical protein
MNAIDQHQRGLYGKFNVSRTDGKDAPGERHYGDQYLVLNLTTDKHSIPAILSYIESCESEYPALAADLRALIAEKVLAKSIYITVPQVTLPDGTVVGSFLAAKYLSSCGAGGYAISIADGKPWVRINYDDARKACLLSGVTLILESQALAIAYDISQQDINWTGGKVGSGSIYQGLHLNSISEAKPASFEPQESERRWHQLSNGERIYDFAGNAFTWVFDNVQGDIDGKNSKIAADSISLTTAPYPSEEKGTGWRPDGARDWSGYALVRGGCWCSESYAGVFYLGGVWRGSENGSVGFRCTKGL